MSRHKKRLKVKQLCRLIKPNLTLPQTQREVEVKQLCRRLIIETFILEQTQGKGLKVKHLCKRFATIHLTLEQIQEEVEGQATLWAVDSFLARSGAFKTNDGIFSSFN